MIRWYSKSLEPQRERYTFISSLPFLLSILLFIFTPIQVILIAAWVSCISSAAASVIGKAFGGHRMTHFGYFPEKSYEGLIAGAVTAYLGVVLAFTYFPMVAVTPVLIFVFGIIAVASFIYVDAFGKYLAFNMLNVLIPGLLVYLTLFLVL